MDFGVVDEFEYWEDHGNTLVFFDKFNAVRLIAPKETLILFRIIEKPLDALKGSNAEAKHIQKEVAGAGIKETSKESMRAIAEAEAERFVLKTEEGVRAFIIDNEKPTETWKLDLAMIGSASTGNWASELVALANKAHRVDLTAAHMSKMQGEAQIQIRITDLEAAHCMRLSKVEFDKLQAQGIYKGVMTPCVQMPNGEFFRLTLEDGEQWVTLTRAFVETMVAPKPKVVELPMEIPVSAIVDATGVAGVVTSATGSTDITTVSQPTSGG
jgi:hypothetical protein